MSNDMDRKIDDKKLDNVNAGSLGDVIKAATSKAKSEEKPKYVVTDVDYVPGDAGRIFRS